MQAIAYLRVSTDEQADSRAGLEAQADRCQRYALDFGAELIGPFADEGVGGYCHPPHLPLRHLHTARRRRPNDRVARGTRVPEGHATAVPAVAALHDGGSTEGGRLPVGASRVLQGPRALGTVAARGAATHLPDTPSPSQKPKN